MYRRRRKSLPLDKKDDRSIKIIRMEFLAGEIIIRGSVLISRRRFLSFEASLILLEEKNKNSRSREREREREGLVFLDPVSKLDTALPRGIVDFDLVQFGLVIHLLRQIRKIEGGGGGGKKRSETNENEGSQKSIASARNAPSISLSPSLSLFSVFNCRVIEGEQHSMRFQPQSAEALP